MRFQEIFYPESQFGGFTDTDGTIAFFNRVNSLLVPDATILDVGCGRGGCKDDSVSLRRNLQVIRGKVGNVIGIDIAQSASQNAFIDEFRHIAGDGWPVAAQEIGLIICDNVLEHIDDPDKFFSEARRVLSDNGYLCIRTANAWSYVAMLGRLIPDRFHSRILQRIHPNRGEEDIFPAYYRCNNVIAIKTMMKKFGFESVVYGYEPEPSYLSWSKTAYRLGVLHQRFAPNIIKTVLFAFGKLHARF